ncbi:GNAT family N-acetyltransferase [Bacillus seohaeanensis]|jgi:ribosomal protein S18 acetylase RimI-like enzyme|uniref:GNAT family N-acetyltransferase n=1 Tax=Bacillus seohaeanensis TaxID=284580 RepID=A0ABW5RPR3_9BACI
MSNGIVIRPASNQDVPELYNLMRQYIVDFYEQPEPNENDLKGLINHLLDNPSSGLQFVAEENGELVGFATLYFTFSTLSVKRQAILNDLFVAPNVRGKKVGEKLFQTSLDYIRENDFSSMTWETAKDNVVAQSLYNKMGGKLAQWLFYEIS